jgi:hypothetical protein
MSDKFQRQRQWALCLALILYTGAFCCGSVTTGKQAFISPIRAVIPKHLPNFAWNRDAKPLRIPLVVNVFLGNLDYRGEGANVFTAVSASDLETYLMEAFPSHQPACVQTGERLHVSFDLWYHVAHIDAHMMTDLEAAVSRGMKEVNDVVVQQDTGKDETGQKIHENSVPVEGEVLDKLRKIHDLYAPTSAKRYRFDSDDASAEGAAKLQEGSWFNRGSRHDEPPVADSVQTYSVLILNLNKKNMSPSDLSDKGLSGGSGDDDGTEPFIYRYSFNHTSLADSFLSVDRCEHEAFSSFSSRTSNMVDLAPKRYHDNLGIRTSRIKHQACMPTMFLSWLFLYIPDETPPLPPAPPPPRTIKISMHGQVDGGFRIAGLLL